MGVKKLKLSHYTSRGRLEGEDVYLLFILDVGIRWGWVVSFTPRPRFSPEERTPDTIVQSRSGHWGYIKIVSPLPGIEPQSPGRLAHSQTLYWLSYPAHLIRVNVQETGQVYSCCESTHSCPQLISCCCSSLLRREGYLSIILNLIARKSSWWRELNWLTIVLELSILLPGSQVCVLPPATCRHLIWTPWYVRFREGLCNIYVPASDCIHRYTRCEHKMYRPTRYAYFLRSLI
jgi:hypothetical protein